MELETGDQLQNGRDITKLDRIGILYVFEFTKYIGTHSHITGLGLSGKSLNPLDVK